MPNSCRRKPECKSLLRGNASCFFQNKSCEDCGNCIRHPATGIFLIDLRFFFAYDKCGGTGRNFAAEVLKGMSAPK
jgi:hypothetical protein